MRGSESPDAGNAGVTQWRGQNETTSRGQLCRDSPTTRGDAGRASYIRGTVRSLRVGDEGVRAAPGAGGWT